MKIIHISRLRPFYGLPEFISKIKRGYLFYTVKDNKEWPPDRYWEVLFRIGNYLFCRGE